MASLNRTPCQPQAQRTELRLEEGDGVVVLSIAVDGHRLSARIEPSLAVRMGGDLVELGLALAPELWAEGH